MQKIMRNSAKIQVACRKNLEMRWAVVAALPSKSPTAKKKGKAEKEEERSIPLVSGIEILPVTLHPLLSWIKNIANPAEWCKIFESKYVSPSVWKKNIGMKISVLSFWWSTVVRAFWGQLGDYEQTRWQGNSSSFFPPLLRFWAPIKKNHNLSCRPVCTFFQFRASHLIRTLYGASDRRAKRKKQFFISFSKCEPSKAIRKRRTNRMNLQLICLLRLNSGHIKKIITSPCHPVSERERRRKGNCCSLPAIRFVRSIRKTSKICFFGCVVVSTISGANKV